MKSTVPAVDIKKNSSEVVRVRAGLYQDEQRLDLRIFYRGAGGQLRASKRGLAFRLDLLPELIVALQEIETALEGET